MLMGFSMALSYYIDGLVASNSMANIEASMESSRRTMRATESGLSIQRTSPAVTRGNQCILSILTDALVPIYRANPLVRIELCG